MTTDLFFRDFFPTAHARLSTGWPGLWSMLQPSWMAATCPERSTALTLPAALRLAPLPTLPLRNVGLLPFQLAGLAVAVLGAARLCGTHAARHAYLHHSLAFFGLMNASSILAHAIAPRGSQLWQAALKLDIAFTGASSLCLLLSQVLPPPVSGSSAAAACWAVLLAMLTAVLRWSHLPWVPEAVYLGTTTLAALATGHRLLWRWLALPGPQRARLILPATLAVLGSAAMVLSLPLDPLLCALAGPWLGTVPLLFGGSALGFAAVVLLTQGLDAAEAGAGVEPCTRRKSD